LFPRWHVPLWKLCECWFCWPQKKNFTIAHCIMSDNFWPENKQLNHEASGKRQQISQSLWCLLLASSVSQLSPIVTTQNLSVCLNFAFNFPWGKWEKKAL
jgi:hypothetical protein